MKRRAQTAAAPAVAKRKKLAKDELLENETYDSQADVVGDRASKSRGTAPTVPLATSSATPKTAATASPRTAADNIARRPRDDLSLVPPIRSALSPLPAQSSLPMYSMSPSNQMASKSYLMAVDPSSSAPSPARLPLTVAPLLQAPLTLNSPVCWARVNRMAWWPGKILTGDNIPEDLQKKRRTTGFQCVKLYNRDVCNWVNPNRIVDFKTNPDGPEERKRPPHGELAAAMEVARTELAAHKSTTPFVLPSSAMRPITKVNTASALPPNAMPLTFSTSPSGVYHAAATSSYTNGVGAYHTVVGKHLVPLQPSAATMRLDSTGSPLNATSTASTASKLSSASTTPTAKRGSAAASKLLSEPLRSAMSVSTPAGTLTTTMVYTTVPSTGVKYTAGIRTMDAKGLNGTPILQHPQAVHRIALGGAANGTPFPVSTPVAPSRASSKASGGKVGRPKASSAMNHTPATSSPMTMTPPTEAAYSEAGSAASSRGPSPVRSGPPATKITDPFKVTEEYSAYRGTASVGHATIAKSSVLGWGSSRSSSSVDSLTVVTSLKRRALDGTCVSKPIARKHFIGMANLGNTCYINSAIQCLATSASFATPLTTLLVSLEDAYRNNGNPFLNGNAKSSNGRSRATATSQEDATAAESSKGRNGGTTPRRRRGSASNGVAAKPTAAAPPSPPSLGDRRARSRKSWFKLSDSHVHNPDDAKFNPLIASLASVLKTLSRPDHLISMKDGRITQASMSRLSNASIGAFTSNGSSSSVSASSSDRSRKKTHPHGVQQQLIANSDDEEMDVDPIGVDDDEEVSSSATVPSPTASSTSVTSSETDFVPSQEVTKVLQAFQNSSGQLLDEKYYTDQHQDISEFILHLLEYAHDQLNTKKPLALPPTPAPPATPKKGRGSKSSQAAPTALVESPRSTAHAAAYSTLSRLEMDCKEWYHYMATNQSPVTNSFDGLLRRSRTCPRGHTATSYEIFRILTLHFEDENAKECTLEDMLRNLRKPEFLDCRCSACGGNDDKAFSQVTDVYILPKYLIITLGRFKGAAWGEQSWWAHKIKTRVVFPLDNLDMAPLFDIAVGQPAPKYNLVAISNHKGSSIHGGHYFSYVRSWPNSEHWVCLNDTTVKEVRLDAIVSNQAYMLFYERQDE